MFPRRTDPTTCSNRSSTVGTHTSRLALAAGVLGGAIAASGGQPVSAQGAPPLPRCIEAIQGQDTAGWDRERWDTFLFGEFVNGEVVGGCVGDFGVGKLVINVLDKETGEPVDGTVDLTRLLNAFQFGYAGFPANSFDPYCDLRWGTADAPGFDRDVARIGAQVEEPEGAEFRFDETGFGGRPLRFLHWITPDPPVTPDGFGAALQPHQIAFSWACDANYDTLTTPAIADVGGGYQLLAGRNSGRSAADGTSDFRLPGSGTAEGLLRDGWQQIDLYVSRRPVVVETTTTTTTTTPPTIPATTLNPAPPTTQTPAGLSPLTGILPETGRESGPFALAAAFLLAVGAAAIGLSRRRPASR